MNDLTPQERAVAIAALRVMRQAASDHLQDEHLAAVNSAVEKLEKQQEAA